MGIRIRRVKCGEEKPACVRCTSTGRTCDGYDYGAPPRRPTQDTSYTAAIARKDFVQSYRFSEALQRGRLIVADIEGTEIEKRYFHEFRLAVTHGLGSPICSSTTFCNRVVPQMSHQHEAVKYAAIALGSAYQLFRLPDTSNARNADGFDRDHLEVFTIRQYNRAISELQRPSSSSSSESIQVTLVCCLTFIYLETFRGNHDAAVTHLTNGLRILDSIPAEYFGFPSVDTTRDVDSSRSSLDMRSTDMRDIMQLFGQLETTACFFASDIQPVVAGRGYTYRKFDDGSDKDELHSLRDVHQAYTYFLRDVLARLYELTRTDNPGQLGRNSHSESEMHQQEYLRLRAARLDVLTGLFMAGPNAPGPDTPEHFCLQLDIVHFRCAQTIVATIDQSLGYQEQVLSLVPREPLPSLSVYSWHTPPPFSPPSQYGPSLLPPPHHNRPTRLTEPPTPSIASLQADMLATATNLITSPTAHRPSRETMSFTNAGIVGPLYLVAVTSPDPALRSQATSLLAEIDDDFGGFFWDGPGLRERLGLVVSGEVPGGGVPFVQDALMRLVR